MTLTNVIERDVEKFVSAALERDDIEAAKTRISLLALPFDPDAVDDRARVYMSLEEWGKALAAHLSRVLDAHSSRCFHGCVNK